MAHALLRNPGSGERGRPHHRLNSGWLRRTFGIDAQYNLVEIATNKSVLTGSTFSRVSYDMPGSYQRFARRPSLAGSRAKRCRTQPCAPASPHRLCRGRAGIRYWKQPLLACVVASQYQVDGPILWLAKRPCGAIRGTISTAVFLGGRSLPLRRVKATTAPSTEPRRRIHDADQAESREYGLEQPI